MSYSVKYINRHRLYGGACFCMPISTLTVISYRLISYPDALFNKYQRISVLINNAYNFTVFY